MEEQKNPFIKHFGKSAFITARPDEYEESAREIIFTNPITNETDAYLIHENIHDSGAGNSDIILIKDQNGDEWALKTSSVKKRSPSKSKSRSRSRSKSRSPTRK